MGGQVLLETPVPEGEDRPGGGVTALGKAAVQERTQDVVVTGLRLLVPADHPERRPGGAGEQVVVAQQGAEVLVEGGVHGRREPPGGRNTAAGEVEQEGVLGEGAQRRRQPVQVGEDSRAVGVGEAGVPPDEVAPPAGGQGGHPGPPQPQRRQRGQRPGGDHRRAAGLRGEVEDRLGVSVDRTLPGCQHRWDLVERVEEQQQAAVA
ncbi:hypothetical protein [Paractinoplanes toevensis]|uniref:Uncharacterized protein n=1 Tax=Paractinoplanes toevensis TaxID=571911 RepID=A0A919TGW5_9ACTN|nr:hypothetical protein [Actinoplanes toevensis]GIM95325.1 hypothetical protein Ato02nite_071180 [Actinoplanes toevensis]